jgi:hypothetical protein
MRLLIASRCNTTQHRVSLNGVQGVASSNLAVPTNQIKELEAWRPRGIGAFCF